MYFLHSIGTCYFLLWICGFRNSDTVRQEEEDKENLINIGLAMCLIGWFFWMAHEVQATIARPATASEYICEKRLTSNEVVEYRKSGQVFFPSEDSPAPYNWKPSTEDQKDEIIYIPQYKHGGEKKFYKLIQPGEREVEYINYPIVEQAAAK